MDKQFIYSHESTRCVYCGYEVGKGCDCEEVRETDIETKYEVRE